MANLLSSLISRSRGTMGALTFNPMLSMKAPLSTTPLMEMPSCKKYKRPHPVPEKVGVNPYKGQALQEWWDWDGKGPYKYRHHHYPNNITLRDVQRRRIFKRHHAERERLNSIIQSDLLPKELRDSAFREKHFELPIDSSAMRPRFRCVVTGRARGNYDEFRVSRFIFRSVIIAIGGTQDLSKVLGFNKHCH